MTEQERDSERSELVAWRDLLMAMPGPVSAGLGNGSGMIGGVLAISAKNVPLVTFNRVVGLGVDAVPQPDDLGAIAAHMRTASIPTAQLQIAPQALTPELQRDLAVAGFEQLPVKWAKMGRSTDNPPKFEDAPEVDEIGPDEAGIFAETINAGFGMPPAFRPWIAALPGREGWRCYVAREGGAVVAGAALYLHGDFGWLGMAATLPDARKQGAQSALIARRIADAGKSGKRWVYTETGMLDGPNPSLANMYRTGFACLHERTNWVLAGGA